MPHISLEQNVHLVAWQSDSHKRTAQLCERHCVEKPTEMAVSYKWASQTIRPWQWQWGLSRSVTSSSLCLSPSLLLSPLFPPFPCLCFTLSVLNSLSLSLSHTHTEKEGERVFISRLYAGCTQPEIAGLTPRCELYRGNVYWNPTEHAINLFLDRRQTRMSLHEGNKGRNPNPGPSWQSSHYESAGGSKEPGSPVSQGYFRCGVPVCLTFSEVSMIYSEVQTNDNSTSRGTIGSFIYA